MKALGIIIEQYKSVYWYLPKTSCTALKTYFAGVMGLKIPYRDGSEMDIHGQDIGFQFTDKVLEGYYNFAYVRNPYDRLMSCYSQKIYKKVDRKVFPDEKYQTGMDFDLWLDYIINEEKPERHYRKHSDFLPDGVDTHQMENDLFLMFCVEPKNVSDKLNLWTPETKEKVYNHYKNDFIRFGYEKD